MSEKYLQDANDLLSQMTLDEKISQLGSCWFYDLEFAGKLDMAKVAEKFRNGLGQVTRVAGASTLDPVSAARTGNVLQEFLVNETRLGIPAILHEESCSGAMVLGGTAFPQMIGLASTFQPDLAEKMTMVIRDQLLALGARQALGPVLDVARDPRWGRNEETFGEDPTLVSNFGVAYVRGMQGEKLSKGVLATGKHFIAHSLSQGGMNCNPVHVGWRELYDVFMAPFHAAIRDADLATIMNSYPELDGEVVATSRRILTEILRGELGFDGLVVSDYEAVAMIQTFHKMAPDLATAGRLGIQAGIDVELPFTLCYGEPLKLALGAGDLYIETINTAVLRHLTKKFELGLFDNPYVDEGKVLEVFETQEQRSLAREIACKSIVLLKNDGLLPLEKMIKKLAVIGPNANTGRNQLSDYSYAAAKEFMLTTAPPQSSYLHCSSEDVAAHEVHVCTVLQGVKELVSSDTMVLYARGCDNLDSDTSGFDQAIAAANEADVVVLVLGDRSGLVKECTSGEFRDAASLNLPGVQEDFARAIFATGKPVVVVLINGRTYALPWLDETANAILEAWLPGEEGGNAIADVLFGTVNPGGKLPVSFPRHVGQLPVFYNHKPSGMKSHMYGDYVAEKATPLYSFGHGLSYTSFEYCDLLLSSPQVRNR